MEIATGFLVPWLTFTSPTWLTLSGIGPCWAVLWLLPWAIEEGELSASIAGLFLGLVLDGISIGGPTQIPVLMLLGLWWGRLGRRGKQIEQSFNLGLLAWLGTAAFGLSLWLQTFFAQGESLNSWGFKTLLSQTLVTSLLAPMVCSWLLFFWRRNRSFS